MEAVKRWLKEIGSRHTGNILNAKKTAQNAVIIGVRFHQIKALVPHGEFLPTVKTLSNISTGCRSNYMAMAYNSVANFVAARLLQGSKCSDGENLSVVKCSDGENLDAVCIPSKIRLQAEKEMESFAWLSLDRDDEERLIRNLEGKEITALLRDYKIIREPKHTSLPRSPRGIGKIKIDNDLEEIKSLMRFAMLEGSTSIDGLSNLELRDFVETLRSFTNRIKDVVKRRMMLRNPFFTGPKSRSSKANRQERLRILNGMSLEQLVALANENNTREQLAILDTTHKTSAELDAYKKSEFYKLDSQISAS